MKTMQPAEAITPDQATCLFSDEFDGIRLDLQAWAECTDNARLICLDFDRVHDVGTLTDKVLEKLARVLLVLWPEWYEGRLQFDSPTEFASRADQLCRERPHVNRKWLTAAATHCSQDHSPVVRGFSPAVQVRQLRLALAEQQVCIAFFITDPAPPSERLLGLSRVAEWLAREAEAAVLVILAPKLSKRPELDAINSTSWVWPVASISRQHDELDALSHDSRTKSLIEQKHLVCPILGRPHPASPGEQILAQYLTTDDELRKLFRFNQRLETIFDNRFLVDLVWLDGRIVVEIDGYGWHSTRAAFNADRQRDYELTLSGYLVLRLPHDLVVQDPELARERIREFVEFRRQYPLSEEITP